MRILFTAAALYLPQEIGGSQIEADELCRSLMRRGHKVAVLARFVRDGFFSWRCTLQKKLLRRKVSRDVGLGYPVWRAWHPWEEIRYVSKRESPDLIVVMAGDPVRMALAAKQTDIPLFIELQDTEFRSRGGTFNAALTYAERREMTFDYQIAAWEQAFLAASNATRDRGDERNFVNGK